MEKCKPSEMSKNLSVVETFKIQGIDFVAIPVAGELTKEKLIQLMSDQFDLLIKESESN